MVERASDLRVLVLCGRSPRHLHVANVLCRSAEVVGIVQEGGSELSWGKLARLMRPRTLLPKAWRWLRDRRRYAGHREAAFFFGDRPPRLDRPELVHEVAHINHPDVLRLVRELRPDLIAVFGTSLLRSELLQLARQDGRLGIVNLHGGLSPEYRGADCTFWALHNGEPHKVGCTLHWIDAGIDTGGLIAHVSPEIRPDDDELHLFWRAVQASAEVYGELLHRLAAGERFGQMQPHKGRLYQVRQRGWRHERRLDDLLRGGLLRGLDLDTRVTWYPVQSGQEEAPVAQPARTTETAAC